MTPSSWSAPILDPRSPAAAWAGIFAELGNLAKTNPSPVELHKQTIAPDRLLAEGAWELWRHFPTSAPRTSAQLRAWWSVPSPDGRAVLIMDALSLRELPALLGGAGTHGAEPLAISVTGSEVPSDTDRFAQALGLPSRSSLSNNGAPAGFVFTADHPFTDVLSYPFEDCVANVPYDTNVVVWHTWLDDLIHVHKRSPDQIHKSADDALQSEGFWKLVDRLRQGRRLVITADHGYAVTRLFSSEEHDEDVIQAMRTIFGASRAVPATSSWGYRFMPPLVLTLNGHHVVMGQRKWKVQGGFPQLCHGGLSLLEVSVPFVEFPPL